MQYLAGQSRSIALVPASEVRGGDKVGGHSVKESEETGGVLVNTKTCAFCGIYGGNPSVFINFFNLKRRGELLYIIYLFFVGGVHDGTPLRFRNLLTQEKLVIAARRDRQRFRGPDYPGMYYVPT